jgi:hypothetical protein
MSRGGRAVAAHGCQAVVEQGHADAVHEDLLAVCRGGFGVPAEAAAVDAEDGNLVLGDQVANDRVSHGLRGRDASAAKALDFDDVALLAFELGGDVIEASLALGAETGAAGGEGNFGRAYGRILVEVLDSSVEGSGAVAGVTGERVSGVRAVGGVLRMLVSGVSCEHGILDASLSAGVYVLDVVGVLGLKLIKLVSAILDGIDLPIYPLLAGHGVHAAPETFSGLGLERLAGGIASAVTGVHAGIGGGCRLRGLGRGAGSLSGLGLRRKNSQGTSKNEYRETNFRA